jgi:hypothetical protein
LSVDSVQPSVIWVLDAAAAVRLDGAVGGVVSAALLVTVVEVLEAALTLVAASVAYTW